MKHKSTMYRHYNKFKDYYSIKQEVYGDGAEERSMHESLHSYISKNPTVQNGQECLQIVYDTLHKDILDAVVDTFFKRIDTKKHCVWLTGSTSSGKSSFITCFKRIFCC
jgi:hypothetical protein